MRAISLKIASSMEYSENDHFPIPFTHLIDKDVRQTFYNQFMSTGNDTFVTQQGKILE